MQTNRHHLSLIAVFFLSCLLLVLVTKCTTTNESKLVDVVVQGKEVSSPGGEPTLFIRLKSDRPQALQQYLSRLGYDTWEESIIENEIHLFASEKELEVLPGALKMFDSERDANSLSDSSRQSITIQHDILFNRTNVGDDLEKKELPQILKQLYGPDALLVPKGYHDLSSIHHFLLTTQFLFPQISQVVDITRELGGISGGTHEGRPIYAIKIGKYVSSSEDDGEDAIEAANVPNVLIVGLHHARELITPEICMYIITQLTSLYGRDPVITRIVDENQIFIIPVVNPDGLEYVHKVNNWWRKNRRNNGDGTFGVDLNRNYDIGWDKCVENEPSSSSIYKGLNPFSEPETIAIRELSRRYSFAKVLDFHSSGREILTGYLCTKMPDMIKQYIIDNAKHLAQYSDYGTRFPSDDGEHQEYQIKHFTAFSFLVETGESFQPPYEEALKEVRRVWPLVKQFLMVNIPLRGHVFDAQTKKPLRAKIDVQGLQWYAGESRYSNEKSLGTYHMFLPQGSYNLTFTAPGYRPSTVYNIRFEGIESKSQLLDVAMQRSIFTENEE